MTVVARPLKAEPEAPARGLHPHRAVTVGLLLIALATLALAVFTLRPTPSARPVALYVSGSTSSSDDQIPILALDPATLADRPDRPPIVVHGADWALSADGSTLVEMHYGDSAMPPSPNPITIVVRDGRTGAERLRFQPTADVIYPRLSQDGRRLLVQHRPVITPDEKAIEAWQVLDTTTGQSQPVVNLPSDGVDYRTWLDPQATRLYALVSPGLRRDATGPAPSTLVAYDLTTGAETGRLALPSVVEGSWPTDRTVVQENVRDYVQAGVAVAPDGERLAIVHGDADLVTLVDARRLQVIQEIRLASQASLFEWLGLAPATAEAKADEGTQKAAVFAPDGRHLIVYGDRSWIDANNRPVWRGLGISLVDLDRGEVVAKALEDDSFFWVQPTPDGRSLYTFGPMDTNNSFVLRRLDAASLQVLADRAFGSYRWLALVATP
jgi:hypothetical protein